ncbi:MAG: ribonuclease H-like domain-containing protein [Synergistaceae bacterium]|jgi:uncharacterized protein YprB with RNaseH-like and TPR domain|nr:ribonuclease H-like domain-containing protein [Synergistaceae bacterium]
MGKFDRFFDESEARAARVKPPMPVRGLPGGSWADDGVYRVESVRGIGTPHGRNALARPEEMRVMEAFGARGSVVFLDLETTGLAGGTGTYAFLCGIGFSSGIDFKVVQFFLEGPSKESRWLKAIDSAIPEDACLVTYNGSSFDIPLLRTRHVLARSRASWDGLPHIDLLHHARRFYKGRLESCSLGSMERHVLGVGRSGEDIPGHLIPEMYMRYLQTRDASRLAGVFYHNELDIVSLAALYCHIAGLLEGSSRDGADLVRAGDIWMAKGNADRAGMLWDMAKDMPRAKIEACVRKGLMAKKAMDHESARDAFLLALDAIRGGERPASGAVLYMLLEELAKLEEHRFKSPQTAMEHVTMALGWLRRNRYLLGDAYRRMHGLMTRRADRLARILRNPKKPGN